MPLDQITNFLRGETTESVSNTQTTIGVVDANNYADPVNGEYNLVLWDADNHPRPDQDGDVEIVRVTGRDTTNNTITVTRGMEGTTAVSHPNGSALQNAPTAGLFDDVASADELIESFATQGASGTVPTSQGDGTLAMESVGGGNPPSWVEDSNSPINSSGSQEATMSISDTSYDKILIFVERATNTSGSAQDIQMRADGITSTQYYYTDDEGTETSSVSAWSLCGGETVNDGSGISGVIRLEQSTGTRAVLIGPIGLGYTGSFTEWGQLVYSNSFTPSSITIRGGSGTVSVKARVYGWKDGI